MKRSSSLHPHRWRRGIFRTVGGGVVALLFAVTPALQAHSAALGASGPKRGGTINVWNGSAPACLDPARIVLTSEGGVEGLVFDNLMAFDPKGRLAPDLATSWSVQKGGRQVTFHLRHGVRFSNGDPFTAKAVKFTLDRILNPAVKSQIGPGELAALTKTQVVDDYTVRLILNTPYRVLLVGLASPQTGIVDPKATDPNGGSCTNVVGTGPYKIQSVAPDFSTVTLVANKYHNFNPPFMSNKAGVPYISKVVLQHISSDSTAISELLAGNLDIAGVPGAQLPRVQGNPNFVFKNAVTTGLWFVGANVSHPPFNNAQVRKALYESINRTALINVAYNGLAKAEYTPMCSKCFFYDKALKKYAVQFNPTDAQRIFAANHVTGPFTLATYGLPTYQAMAEAMQAQLASEGVTVNIVAKPPADELALLGKGDFDFMLLDYIAADPLLIDDFYRSTAANKSGLNFLRINDTALNQAFKLGLASLNQKKAQAAYDTAQKILLTKYYMQPILTTLRKTAIRKTIKGVHIGFAGGIAYPDLYLSK